MSGSMMFTSSCKGKDTVCNCIEAVEGVWISSCVSCVYYVWEYDVHKLMQLEEPIDIFLSHDWLLGITDYGNWQQLVCYKNISKMRVSGFLIQRVTVTFR